VSYQDATPASAHVLGAVYGVTPDGSIVDVPSASQRRLLGLLAVHAPRQLRAEWLADVLGVTTGALRTTVSRLRTTIGPATLRTTSTGYSLEGDVDATQFCSAVANADKTADKLGALEQALTLWTGPVLEEFQGEEWARGETARLTEIHAASVDEYVDQLISAHRETDAIAAAEGQIGQYPYRDRSRGLLIRALALAGRQADALRAFQSYRSLLVEEIGTEPSPEVVRTERRVATGWNGVDANRELSTPIRAMDIPLPANLAHRVAFVGRSTEQEVLRTQLALVGESGLRCVVVGGEAGMGKTTLLAEFANSVTSSAMATVLYGRCDETGVPLEPFRSVLDTCVEHAPLDLLTEHVAHFGGELTRLCPRLGTRVATTPAPTGSDDATERFLTFDAAVDLLRRIASRRPLVLILDDLQWAEPTALLLLRQLVRTLADAPVLVLVSRRDPGEQISDQLRTALAEFELDEVSHLQLTGLNEAELAELVVAATRAVPDPELRRVTGRLRDETAGNPLYASQLVRHWMDLGRATGAREGQQGRPTMVMPEGVPPSLREVVWSRVRTLGQDVFAVLAAASVLGLEFPEDILLETLDLPDETVRGALDAAVAAGILIDLRSVRRAMRFVHALVANAMYSEIGPSSRARMHERVVRALTKDDGSLHPDVVLQLARHCTLAGLPEEALHWSVSAGDHAFAHLAPTEAAHHYQVALDAAEALHRSDAQRADLLVRLGHAQFRAGDPQAQVNLGQGAELARRSGQRQTLIRAALVADLGIPRVGTFVQESEFVESALEVADPADTATYARLLALLSKSLTFTPDVGRRVTLAHRALRLAEESDDATLLAGVAPAVLAALWAPGNERLRNEVAARALSAAEASGDPLMQFSVNLAARQVAIESGDPVMAAHTLTRLRATAQNVGEPYLRWIIGLAETFEAMMAGRLSDAEALAAEALDFGLQIGATDAFAIYAGQFFVLRTFAGRYGELFPLVEQAARENPTVLPFKLAYGIICVAVGHADAARDILYEGLESGLVELGVDNFWMTSVIAYVIIAIELDDREAAARLLPVIEPYASVISFNGATSQGPVSAYAGKLASLLGRHDEAEGHLRAALATATAFGWTYHRATTLFALAQARHRRLGGLDEEGRSWLSESSEFCRAYGFGNWIGQIDDLAASQPPTALRS
jgi:DNA-binding SARP family transcriptional activator/tetratricopeptide (TPR) repeat protein